MFKKLISIAFGLFFLFLINSFAIQAIEFGDITYDTPMYTASNIDIFVEGLTNGMHSLEYIDGNLKINGGTLSVPNGIYNGHPVLGATIGPRAFFSGFNGMATHEASVALGAYVLATNYSSFVWNGINNGSYYKSHGEGTFNINPTNGLAGIYIGQTNLETILKNLDGYLTTNYSGNLKVSGLILTNNSNNSTILMNGNGITNWSDVANYIDFEDRLEGTFLRASYLDSPSIGSKYNVTDDVDFNGNVQIDGDFTVNNISLDNESISKWGDLTNNADIVEFTSNAIDNAIQTHELTNVVTYTTNNGSKIIRGFYNFVDEQSFNDVYIDSLITTDLDIGGWLRLGTDDSEQRIDSFNDLFQKDSWVVQYHGTNEGNIGNTSYYFENENNLPSGLFYWKGSSGARDRPNYTFLNSDEYVRIDAKDGNVIINSTYFDSVSNQTIAGTLELRGDALTLNNGLTITNFQEIIDTVGENYLPAYWYEGQRSIDDPVFVDNHVNISEGAYINNGLEIDGALTLNGNSITNFDRPQYRLVGEVLSSQTAYAPGLYRAISRERGPTISHIVQLVGNDDKIEISSESRDGIAIISTYYDEDEDDTVNGPVQITGDVQINGKLDIISDNGLEDIFIGDDSLKDYFDSYSSIIKRSSVSKTNEDWIITQTKETGFKIENGDWTAINIYTNNDGKGFVTFGYGAHNVAIGYLATNVTIRGENVFIGVGANEISIGKNMNGSEFHIYSTPTFDDGFTLGTTSVTNWNHIRTIGTKIIEDQSYDVTSDDSLLWIDSDAFDTASQYINLVTNSADFSTVVIRRIGDSAYPTVVVPNAGSSTNLTEDGQTVTADWIKAKNKWYFR